MEFDLKKSIEILSRTPDALDKLLSGLDETWILSNEGGETWSPFDVMGHLIYCEQTNWMPRVEIILSDRQDKAFTPFDRFAQFELSKGKNMQQLLDEFKSERQKSLGSLKFKNITEEDLDKTGVHPTFGEITLRQQLSTWTVHDLAHTGQIVRVMAKQYSEAVGPWKEFLPILTR